MQAASEFTGNSPGVILYKRMERLRFYKASRSHAGHCASGNPRIQEGAAPRFRIQGKAHGRASIPRTRGCAV